MGIENSPELNSTLNVEGEPRSTVVKFYYSEETDDIVRITLDSEDRETTLFPIQLESGKDYIPNLDEFDFRRRDLSLQSDSHGSSYVEIFQDLEHYLETDLSSDSFDRSLLRFLRENYPSGYAQLVVEQIAVRGHIHRNRNRISTIEYHDYLGNIIMEWPDYYPGKEEYGMKYLPCSESLQYAQILNKVLCICENPSRYDLTKEHFDYDELEKAEKAFLAADGSMRHHKQYPIQSQIAKKVLEFRGFNYPGKKYLILGNYFEYWFGYKKSEGELAFWKDRLEGLADWATKEE
jgi:hypothetical protein